MNLLIDNRTDEPLTAELEDAIRRAAAEALRYEEFDEDCEISVSIVDNEEIREINRQFRSIDRANRSGGYYYFSGACEGAGGGIRTFSETGNCVSDGAQYAASFRLRPHGAGGGSGDVPPPEGDFITGRLSEEVKVLEAALA